MLDLNGKTVAVKSRKNWPEKDFFKELSATTPLVVACDTSPPSHFARKVASVFRARLFTPKHSLHVIEKVNLAKGLGKNVHERDALAAARKAYNSTIQNKVRQFIRIAGKPTEKQKALVLSGVKMRDAAKG